MKRRTNKAVRQTSIGVTREVSERIERLSQERYGKRGMARSIEDWLADLIKQRDFLARYAATSTQGTVVRKSIWLTGKVEEMIEDAIKRIRILDPLSKNEQTRLLRAAIDLAIENRAAEEARRLETVPALQVEPQLEVVVPLETERPRLARKPTRKRA